MIIVYLFIAASLLATLFILSACIVVSRQEQVPIQWPQVAPVPIQSNCTTGRSAGVSEAGTLPNS